MKDNYTKSEVQEMREKIKAATPVPATREALTNLVELIIGQPLVEKEPETVEPWSVWENERERVVFLPCANSNQLVGFYINNGRLTSYVSVTRFRASDPNYLLLELKGHKLIGHATPSFTIKPV